ncbi:DoxX family protein [Paenibacillus aceris]|uniref:Thiosulfate dehydrogenase [quinone] large subunit n=1 Tax=Paenibacillus aceris TaxID=869555 RepID=A0ABS4I9Z2_9BACL|nr:DoxX family protein [Paenibacillus aceris]MBP1967754.1 thiosulfate dehydrogenase [quinone] large subunit [Paenibacillus aceris]
MVIKFLKENIYASYGLLVLRFYLGWSWLQAGWGKIAGGNFDSSGFLKGAIKNASGDHPAVQSWWADFINHFALPNAGLFNVLVPWGEFLVGLGLILGIFTTFAVLMGLVMNFSYMFSGTTSTNPQMVLMGMLILAAGLNAGRIGVDRWVIPVINKKILKKEDQENFLQAT